MSETEGAAGVERALKTHWHTIMLVVVAVLGAGVLVALVTTLGSANRQRDRALELQSHSYEVMILARTLSGTISGAEASLGRYVISRDKQLGRLYYDQWQLAGDQIDRLDQVTDDRGDQQARIDALRRAYIVRGKELSLTALSTSYGQPQALSHYYQARKAPSLTQINMLLDGINVRERRLLAARSNAAQATIARSNKVVHVLIGFGILIVLGAIALGWLTVRALGERAVARAEAEVDRQRVEGLEAAVAAATAELKQQAIERAETEAKLRQIQKMEAVGQLTGGIAHDFNNMLAVVLGGLELAKRNLTQNSKLASRHIDNAMDGANRAATLTRRLLAFSRAEPLLPEAIEAGALIAGMSSLLDRTLGDAITVATKDDGGDWRIWVDRHQLENALLNLAVNARDAMDGRGTLTIATGGTRLEANAIDECPAGDYVTIAVADSGCGMSAETLEHVFEPFFTTKPVGKGTGLGLSQIFGFVRQSGGQIAIQSVPQRGTTVTVYLPRHTAVAAAAAPAEQPADKPTTSVHAGLDILVVEDDPRVRTATIGALEELGHHPIGCDDPLKAPAMLEQHDSIDLIVSDVLMPGQTGPEMIAALSLRYPHIAVLFVTGYAGEAAEEFGGNAVLRKPFTIAALERAIAEVMAIDRPAPSSRIAAE